MAEAVKEITKQKIATKTRKKETSTEEEISNELTDLDLERRSKSLKIFINNLEPSLPEATAPSVFEPPDQETPKTSQDKGYYEIITEKAQQIKQNEKEQFSHLNTVLSDIKTSQINNTKPIVEIASAPQAPLVEDFNLAKIKEINKLQYPKLNWNQTIEQSSIDSDLNRFYESDQLCKDLEVYYKCKIISNDLFNQNLICDFIKIHSNLNEFQYDPSNTSRHYKHEFFELINDYYEARRLVLKCERHINEYKWIAITEQMSKIWSFEKYTIESFGICGDQQRCRHELTSEKAYLNRLELTKLQDMFYELRFNLIKNGLISAQFCSKLAKLKLESYINEFLLKFNFNKNFDNENYSNLNNQLKILIDILFYFYRKVTRPSNKTTNSNSIKNSDNADIYYEIDAHQNESQNRNLKTDEDENEDEDDENLSDEIIKSNLSDWIKTLCCLALNESNTNRIEALKIQNTSLITKFSTLHFDNIFYVLQHLLHVPGALNFSYLIQLPFLSLENPSENSELYKTLNLNSSKSDSLINLYFDNYLKLIASFSYGILYRQEFLGLSKSLIDRAKQKPNSQTTDPLSETQWQFIDLEGESETIESILVDINEDDLIQLYYQIPFNNLFSFLWKYLEYQGRSSNQQALKIPDGNFRKNYVSMKIISFLDFLSRLSIRSLLIYNRLKFKNFSKLIGKTLREIIKFISTLLDRNYQIDNLRTHYDNFIKRIFTTILYSARLKSIRWTILNQFNIGKLNLKTKWLLLSIMCGIDVFHPNFEIFFKAENTRPIDYINQSLLNDLEYILVKESSNTNDIELLTFLRTLHFLIDLENTCSNPPQEEIEFMSQVIKVIFKISYCYPSTRDICYKEGNSILFAISSAYPCLIGFILSEIDVDLEKIGKKCLYLCTELPLSKWLPYIDLKKDMFFIQKSLLQNVPNSILFRFATNLIDNLNFSMSTREKSEAYLTRIDSNLQGLINSYGLIDLGTVFKIRLSIILFELHSRLTNYTYFNKNDERLFGSLANFDELNQAYYKLTKEKRLEIVYWIWSTFYRMNLFFKIDSLRLIDYLEDLTFVYAPMSTHFITGNYLCKFYQIYLGISQRNEISMSGEESESSQTIIQLVHQPKCPLESYLRLVYTCSSNNLNDIFEHSIELIQNILNTNKKFGNNMTKISYLIIFDWFDNLIRKFLEMNRLEELRQSILKNLLKINQIVLLLFTFNTNQFKLTDNYCVKIEKNFRKYPPPQGYEPYLLIWTEILVKSTKNWFKYKNIVKLIDYLICYTFKNSLKNGLNFINLTLLEEFLNLAKNDFGINENSRPASTSSTSSIPNQESQNTSWTPSSISWLSSSLSYVVSTTTSQLTNSVGAAIGAFTNTNSEFFESNQQNFSYDKRLYKECPYIGFYLSLCEERIEAQLSLWTVFRSFLLGINDPLGNSLEISTSNLNSVSFIETCWKKTLSLINKTNNLSLNFSPQRLMLFKWCERAVELDYDHPLLILYWQKFFSIYLDKDYHSTLNQLHRSSSFDTDLNTQQPVQSVTFKLFTSTSQINSLLKQMKKNLELTSQHYAYRETYDPQINELMSKLFYALSLWIDETRLHDPNLYLPALPVHYEPNLLNKIFSKNSDFWTEFIEVSKLDAYLKSVGKNVEKIKSNSSHSLGTINSLSSSSGLFFKQNDRLVLKLPSLNELNLNFRSPLKDKFGDSIENLLRLESMGSASSRDEANLILNISEHLIKNIYKYNKDYINHNLNHMLKLDDKLTNKYLIHLWHNEMCEKYVQVGCTSLVNPMHQCSRPAMVKFVYEIATKRDQLRHEIRENRSSYDKLISNFTDLTSQSKFPHDEIVVSMVALSQLIKRLLRNHHFKPSEESNNGYILTKLFYLLIDLYESHMNHPNDVLNPAKSITSTQTKAINLTGWSILFKNNDSFDVLNEQFNADSIHLYMFDLIHLIGTNFIHSTEGRRSPNGHRKTNQHVLLEKIIQKLTSTINMSNVIENSATLSRPSSSGSQIPSTRRSSSILLNLTRNKLSLMSLCAQYVEPNDLDLFNEFYMSILCSISSILLNETRNESESDPNLPSLDSTEMINQKFSIILQLLTKFSFINLNYLLKNEPDESQARKICTDFVDINLNFLTELNLEGLSCSTNLPDIINEEIKKRDHNLKLILDQCIDNYISILNVSYPFYFEFILRKTLEFSSFPHALKYGSKSLITFLNILKQNELIMINEGCNLTKWKYEDSFKYLKEFFMFEKSKFSHTKKSFLSHWSIFSRQLSQLFSNLTLFYFDKFLYKDYDSTKFNSIFNILCDLYLVWIESSTVLEITSNSQIDVKEIYKNEISTIESRHELTNQTPTNSHSAILIMIDSFFETFHFLLERVQSTLKNYALNKLIHFYYEQIVCPLSFISQINDNTLDCYHECMSKFSTTWFGDSNFEPDYRSVNLMCEISSNPITRPLKFLAFNIVCYFDLNKITDSYFRQPEIKPIQINDLLRCFLQLLTEFCLRDSIRESDRFDTLLRPVYNQAEVLQCWSMLSDNSYSSIVMERFLPSADYRYVFASRGTDRGLLMILLKSAAEFYSLAERNSLSCFSSAKRRTYLKVICELLLKPSVQVVKTDLESFQNCIMNLLTDIETFSISAVTENSINSLNLNHEIQLLIDESLCLITQGDTSLNEIYQSLFESWLSSSKDSPILTHFINRLSRNYNLLISEKNNEKYCRLLELCIEVFYETSRSDLDCEEIEKNLLLSKTGTNSDGWKILMNEIDFIKIVQNNLDDLFESKLLQNSSYLLLNCYMTQRLALLKASMSYEDGCLKYTEKILSSFLNGQSKPRCSKEEKFILILNKLLDFYLNLAINSSGNLKLETIIGEQILKLVNLLSFYGEDTLSANNPCSEGQSLGSDLLASIGLNILAKKSQFSLKFRFFCRSMAICLLKQVLIVKNLDQVKLFPDLSGLKKDEFGYKIRLSHLDNGGLSNESFNLGHHSSSDVTNVLSSSLPTSNSNKLGNEDSVLHQKYNQIVKQVAYQFHLIYQTKMYTQFNQPNLTELANYVNEKLTQQAQYFCLPQCLNMSKYLSLKLFNDKSMNEIDDNRENLDAKDSKIELLALNDNPICFEPISSLTNVFFDRDNQQIFCVRSNGVGGVVAKGSKSDSNLTFRMEDKGNVATIKFNPNMSVLAIRRRDKCAIDFLNFKNSQPQSNEYSQAFRAKSIQFQECYWLDNNEILLVSEQGFEHYQLFPEKRALKLVKYFSMPLNWLIWSREAQVFIVSTGSYGSILYPYVYTKGTFMKLPKFEADLPLPVNVAKYRHAPDANQSGNRYFLNESDVVVGKIYNEFYVMIIRQMSFGNPNIDPKTRRSSTALTNGFSEIAMYKLLTDSPAKKTNILKINLSGRFTFNIIDELIIVHHRNSYSSLIFDIRIPGEFDGYTTCNHPIIKKASIELKKTDESQQSNFYKLSSSPPKYTPALTEIYSMNWIMFLPDVIIDAKLGFFWHIELNLKNGDLRPFSEFENDNLKLTEFLLNRKNTKLHVLKVVENVIQTKSSLKTIGNIFDKINEVYRVSFYLLQNEINQTLGGEVGSLLNNQNEENKSVKNQIPFIEQYDMHNLILYPLLDDEKWWNSNSKFTIAIIVEYFRSLNCNSIPIEHYLYKLLVNALIKANQLYQLHQYLQYHVLSDSKPLACLLLSIQSTYSAANQLALDMLKRLGTANEEIIDVLLSSNLVLSALRFAVQTGIVDDLNPGKFLETAKDLEDPAIYYETFKFFEERNMRLRGTPYFKIDENCDFYVQHFNQLFNKVV
ncbi:unnamed protein product [Brachionus calyciflorus]|uniref:Ectopic P granules protein 5-like protein n=1 Tax=Brachionus calyciflorus TaxID=104777 RepID=A0A813RE45_9BILA|nr:unnamed protein product [Brachionus calyciflorus]